MMRVLLEQWNGKQEVDLGSALWPKVWTGDNCGALESARAQAESNARAIGNIAALLVEKGVFTLDEAADACGVSGITAIE